MNINTEINRLLNFAKQRGLISEDDYYYSANLLIDVLHVCRKNLSKVRPASGIYSIPV